MADVIELVRGDSEVLSITIVGSGGNPVDLTGATVFFTAKRRKEDSDSDAVIRKTTGAGITVTNAAGGVIAVAIDPADTDDLGKGKYRYDVQVKEASGRVSTAHQGSVLIVADVSRATT